jgi:NAD(P)-dependent dehydrogenase (short-subunit alcohol dehydrogenase family)
VVVVAARFIVGLRELNGIIAGTTGMRWVRFLIYNAIGAVVRVTCWVSVGYLAGDHIKTIIADVTSYSRYVLIALGVFIAALIVRAVIRRRRRAGPPSSSSPAAPTPVAPSPVAERLASAAAGTRDESGVSAVANDDFSGRAVYVFGAAGALGSGLVAAFSAAGAEVTAVDRATSQPGSRQDGVRYVAASVLDDNALAELFDAGPAPWAVVNTIGGYAPRAPLAKLDRDVLVDQLELNLVSAALVTKHALRVMAPAGQGRLVHTASRAGVVTQGAGFAYSVSKLGVLHLVKMAAEEVAGSGVTVNCVVPSIIDTPANRAAIPNADHASWPKVPDIAQAYLFLASPRTHLTNGATIPV